ncbi:MAG: 6-bladed beta-propeller [Balneolaceae bacterium]|nr:MAG: 6-bladed beta-propeller [Balneolaceae bacterium]
MIKIKEFGKFSAPILIFLISGLALGCSEERTYYPGNEILHPTKENIPDPNIVASDLNISGISNIPKHDLNVTFQELDENSLHATIGQSGNFSGVKIDNSSPLVNIADVVTDREGRIILLDDHLSKIFVYDRNGEIFQDLGGRGQGPGEFRSPVSLTLDNAGNLYVLHAGGIEIFSNENGHFSASSRIDIILNKVVDMCYMNGALYISGFTFSEVEHSGSDSDITSRYPIRVSSPIQIVDIHKKEITHSFGVIYKTAFGWPVFDASLSEKYLFCDEESDMLVTIFRNFPFLYGYTSSGELKWVSKMSDFRYLSITEKLSDGLPTLTGRATTDFYNQIYPFMGKKDSNVLFQIGYSINQVIEGHSRLADIIRNNNLPQFYTFSVNSVSGELAIMSHHKKEIRLINENVTITSPELINVLDFLYMDRSMLNIYNNIE